jgi:hypothetical protein
MRHKRIPVFLTVALVVFCFVVLKTVHAQRNGNVGMIVHPSTIELNAAPGETVTGTITLDNLMPQAAKIRVDLRNFVARGEEGSVSLTTDDTGYSLAKWIKVSPSTIDVEPHSSNEFTYTVTVPKNAEPGGHFGSIVFTTVPPAIKGTGAVLSLEVASLISLEVPGNATEKAVIKSFTVDKPFYEFGPVIFSTRINNQGARHIVIIGSIIAKGWFGQKYIIHLSPPENILPGATKRIEATLENKWLIGPFTANFIAAYGTTSQQLNAGIEFTAFPVRYGIAALVILFLLFLARNRIVAIIKISVRILLTGKLPK